jgi:hypothetical protein
MGDKLEKEVLERYSYSIGLCLGVENLVSF